VFPSDDAEDAAEFMERVKSENAGVFPYERVIFIDSTWNQTYKICHDPKVVRKSFAYYAC
jgi:DTW domain-containing protein YfiP